MLEFINPNIELKARSEVRYIRNTETFLSIFFLMATFTKPKKTIRMKKRILNVRLPCILINWPLPKAKSSIKIRIPNSFRSREYDIFGTVNVIYNGCIIYQDILK